jgi:steroid delta-isomerase-like uncharacterized protein
MPDTTPEENKAFVQRFYDQVVNHRNVDSLPDFLDAGETLAADGGSCGVTTLREMMSNPLQPEARLVPRTTARPRKGDAELPPGLEALVDFTRHVLTAFPDMLVNVDSLVAEGNTVVAHWSGFGTHSGELLGTPPTHRVISLRSVDYFTFHNGKIANHQGYPDSARVLASLGQLPRTPIARVLTEPGGE